MSQVKTNFQKVVDRPSFPHQEEDTLKFWTQIDAFHTQLKKTEGKPEYTFYDGPPFATGLPHYGHICAGTIKDIVTRYASQNGYHVDRRFGWDCHGLPVEYEIDKKLGIKGKDDILKMGIANYNNECRSIVMRYSKEWREIITRFGRWIDFDRDYKTLDLSYMESIWYVFKQIFERGLVYRGCKVMPYSTTCNTVLSNFEAGQNYQEVLDPSVHITFPLVEDPSVSFVAWTTTPWTLPTNLALVVNPTFEYIKFKDLKTEQVYIVAECRIKDIYSKEKKPETCYQVLQKYMGSDLVGKEYVPLFDYYADRRQDGCFRVLGASFVTSDSGTGIVHAAPAFGDEDYKVCVKNKVIRPDDPPCPLDANGRYTSMIPEYQGIFIKEADKLIRADIKKKGRLLIDSQIRHSYPMCWRSDTPLIYKATATWFIKVTDIKEDLIKNNKDSYWVPKFAQESRFNNWLENANDWCFSRNRCWGNPIPIWVSEDFEEVVCVGSIQELKDLTGVSEVTDLHREFIDHLTIPSKQGKGVLRRIEEVFDCWFESGSMPYAQVHYPFSISQEKFDKIFPADFIGEGIDQTRGWFYTLNVISTAIRNQTPYKNLIVNGIVLAADGKKMSKRLKNYPDPMDIVKQHGADAVRLYLANSPLVRGETLNFKEDGVKGIVRDVFLPWYNAYRFLIQNISRWENSSKQKFVYNEKICHDASNLTNFMDSWIVGAIQNLISFTRQEMAAYRLYTVAPKLINFLEYLTNWYVRLNRNRLKGDLGLDDQVVSLNVLFEVILKVSILMAPYVPYITDGFYQNLKLCINQGTEYYDDSIHFLQIPQPDLKLIDVEKENVIDRMQKIIDMARNLRENNNLSMKQPLLSLTVVHKDQSFLNTLEPVLVYIKEEINVAEIIFTTETDKYIELKVAPNAQTLGKRLKAKFNKAFQDKVRALTPEQVQTYLKNQKITVDDVEIVEDELVINSNFKTENLEAHQKLKGDSEVCVILDTRQDENLKNQGTAREVVNKVQRMRKAAGLVIEDDIVIFYQYDQNQENLHKAFQTQLESMRATIKKPFVDYNTHFQANLLKIAEQEFDNDGDKFKFYITYNGVFFNHQGLEQKFNDQSKYIKQYLECYNIQQLQGLVSVEGVLQITINGNKHELRINEDFYLGPKL